MLVNLFLRLILELEDEAVEKDVLFIIDDCICAYLNDYSYFVSYILFVELRSYIIVYIAKGYSLMLICTCHNIIIKIKQSVAEGSHFRLQTHSYR